MKICAVWLLGLISAIGSAQTNVVYTWTIQSAASDAPVSINVTQDAATAALNNLFATAAPGVSPSTFTSAVGVADTTLALASTAGLVVGNGVCISASAVICGLSAATNLAVSGGEIALITAINGLDLTVKRAAIGSAAAYANGKTVTFVRAGSYSQAAANIIRDFYASIIPVTQWGAQSAQTAAATIAAAQATLATASQIPH